MTIPRRYVLAGLSSLLLAFLLSVGLVFFPATRFLPHALATSHPQSGGTTCAQTPTVQHCNTQDPERQGCAADAETLDQENIVEDGSIIGSVERRWSPTCQSWWGRVFDDRFASKLDMFITIADTTISANPTFVSNRYRILYSWMIFDASPTQQIPAITGSLLIDAILPPESATLPALTPGQ